MKPIRAFPRVSGVRYVDSYRLELTFSDGVRGTIDLRERIVNRGGVFKALESIEYFRQVSLDREVGTIVWPNGVDFCPDVLHDLVAGLPSSAKQSA